MAVIRSYDRPEGGPIVGGQAKSIVSILAIIAAVASFFIHSGFIGVILAVVAVVLGIVGFMKAASPRVSGGILSLCAIGIGLIALVFALLRGIFHVIS